MTGMSHNLQDQDQTEAFNFSNS